MPPFLPARHRLRTGCLLPAAFLALAACAQNEPINPQFAAAVWQAQQAPVVQAEFDPDPAALGTRLTYRLAVAANPEGVSVPEQPPAPPGFSLELVGRAMGQRVTNNLLTTFLLFNYRVRGDALGSHTMPPFTIMANGRAVPVPPATLRVLPANDPQARRAATLLAELPPGNIYIGQSIPIRAALIEGDQAPLGGWGPLQVLGDSFITEPATSRYSRESRTWAGQTVPATIVEMLVTPLKEGPQPVTLLLQAMTIAPAAGTATANSTTLFDSEPATLVVQHLPTNGLRPGFNGAVGMLQLDPPRLSTNRLHVGDALALQITIRGSNALARFNPPNPVSVPQWQMLPPVSDGIPPAIARNRGFTTFAYTLIPLTPDARATPPIPFSSFDPVTGNYVDLTIPSLPVTVLPVPGTNPTAQAPSPEPANSESASIVEGPMLPGLALSPGSASLALTPLHQRSGFLALQGLPAAALAWCAWREYRRRRREAHPDLVLRAAARRRMRRQLRRRRHALANRDLVTALEATAEALREFASPHTGGHPSALVCHDVLAALPNDCRQAEHTDAIVELFARMDARRFRESELPSDQAAHLASRLDSLLQFLKGRL